MCVIVYKPSKVQISREILEKCAKANPHLMGAMYFSNRGIELIRGCKSVDKLLHSLPDNWKSHDICFHFRIATSGKVNVENSHPFPIFNSRSQSILAQTRVLAKAALMHNGIVPALGSKKDLEKLSDTALLVKNKLSKLSRFQIVSVLSKLANQTGSHFIYVESGKESFARFFGDWKKLDGLFFSNLNWRYASVSRAAEYDEFSSGADPDYDTRG